MNFFKFLERKGTVVFLCLVAIILELVICALLNVGALFQVAVTGTTVVGGWMFTANVIGKFSNSDKSGGQ